MKVLVCGGRGYSSKEAVFKALDDIHADKGPIKAIVHGDAKGADSLADEWARSRLVEARRYPADWGKHGKAAGPIRNQEMLDKESPDLVVAFSGGRGTANMVARAKNAGIRVIGV